MDWGSQIRVLKGELTVGLGEWLEHILAKGDSICSSMMGFINVTYLAHHEKERQATAQHTIAFPTCTFKSLHWWPITVPHQDVFKLQIRSQESEETSY